MDNWCYTHGEHNRGRRKIAIIFVHGLNGSKLTWQDRANGFIDTFRKDKNLMGLVNMYSFIYHASIAEFRGFRRLLSILPVKWVPDKLKRFNVDLDLIGSALATGINGFLNEYDRFIIVAHSMGGIIVKEALGSLVDSNLSKIAIVYFLSVPHRGSKLADIAGALPLGNPQLRNLKTFSKTARRLDSNLAARGDLLPRMVYQGGSNDDIVRIGSAIPLMTAKENTIITLDNHYSVLEIESATTHAVYHHVVNSIHQVANSAQSLDDTTKSSQYLGRSAYEINQNDIDACLSKLRVFMDSIDNQLGKILITKLESSISTLKIDAPNAYQRIEQTLIEQIKELVYATPDNGQVNGGWFAHLSSINEGIASKLKA